VECPNLRDIREKYFTVSSLADLFNRVDNHTVIDFIKETHFHCSPAGQLDPHMNTALTSR